MIAEENISCLQNCILLLVYLNAVCVNEVHLLYLIYQMSVKTSAHLGVGIIPHQRVHVRFMNCACLNNSCIQMSRCGEMWEQKTIVI